MEFRKAESKDSERIANVLVESYNIHDLKEGISVFANEVKKGHNYIVAVDDGKVVGIVTWVMHGLLKHELCELDRIAVLPECRGKGIAKELFNKLIEDAKAFYEKNNSKLRKLYLLTHADNIRAHKFYEKLGFKHETTLKEHYYKDKDEFVFSMFF
ncbi:MAG: GNAT family N-acetyltransferase [Candidatus Woesearchaeota archaeon]|jgi:ribosomal protein S18 acetylase RimI-like enzyme|nr:GNAT family N-acetyltransferase [Candidatus Woesearchaeota archaeon]MDP7622696.1 GNAT family N-acetyltransferase [Candidatus Woesearchaeota archaeon]HJN57213.1 GNAT family N-acetyltransferase [Candidatus Woesearchaeota archaeon]|tara:strand:- start:4669 stop:5136 length:468 start_codon:yes stop_codon:yes gene_type:complete